MPPTSPPLSREPIAIVCADGWQLRGELVTDAETPPVAVAVVGHAMMVDRRTLDRTREPRARERVEAPDRFMSGPHEGYAGDPRDAARASGRRGLVSHLASRGLAVMTVDARGHGASGPRAGDGGEWSYDDLVELDCAALFAFARERFPSLATIAIGHSLFGHVALAHVARHRDAPLDGLVLLACNVPHPGWSGPSRLAKYALIEVMSLATKAVGYLPVRRLGLGSDDESRGYVADFTRNARTHGWRARDGFDYWRALPSVTRPVLALVGAGDRLMAPPSDAGALVAPLLSARLRVVGRASGLAFDPDHMGIVLDERARPVWNEAAEFARACPRLIR